MTALEKERKTAPRSALRYRPIDTDQAPASQATTRARKSRPDAHITAAPAKPDDLEEEQQYIPRRRSQVRARQVRQRQRIHPLFFIAVGTLVTLLLWVGVTQLIAWGANQYNAIVYGSPRTFQIDAVVGQGDSQQHPSHFTAINLHGIITILEFPAGDPGNVRELTTLTVPGINAGQAVAFLRFIDLNHNGQPDLLITIDGVESVMVNNGKTFRQPTPIEEQQIFQELQRTNSSSP